MTIGEKLSRDRVSGFLRNENGRIVNGRGEEILLCGMGVGNWLLPEGYMWKLGGRYTRPSSIEALVRHLCGSEYAARFWKTFRERYITEADVRAMAEAGFNSVRLPVNWRVVMEDEPGIRWKEEGFDLIDRFLGWCGKWGLYVCLDLHGAPGGQTGHNIDDSWDDVPRLLTDTESDSRDKTLALWREFARRYRSRWIVGMYDLLNEPVRTSMEGTKELPDLSEALRAFYRDCIREVRRIDGEHMLSIESVYWASRADFFTERFDENAAAHFHRYWCPPDITVLRDFLAVRERLGIALYLGETGENDPRWFAAMYPLALENGIGVNVWPWKKMETGNSPCSVKKPAGWDWITGFAQGGDRPSYARAQAIFDEYLENVRFENCDWRAAVIPSITRSPGCVFKACDFASSSGTERIGDRWEDMKVRFTAGGAAEYGLMGGDGGGVLAFAADFGESSGVEVAADGEVLCRAAPSGKEEIRVRIPRAGAFRMTVSCTEGAFVLGNLRWEKE